MITETEFTREERADLLLGNIIRDMNEQDTTKEPLINFLLHCNQYLSAIQFFEEYAKAVKESSIDPKKFAEKNNINYTKLFKIYEEWFISNNGHHTEDYEYWIKASSKFVAFCDFFGIEIEKHSCPTKLYWQRPDPYWEEEFKTAIVGSSKEDCKNFARLFSKKPEDWFVKEEYWLDKFKD